MYSSLALHEQKKYKYARMYVVQNSEPAASYSKKEHNKHWTKRCISWMLNGLNKGFDSVASTSFKRIYHVTYSAISRFKALWALLE